MKGSDASFDRRYKTPESRSLDRDRAVQMRSADKRFKKRFKSPPLILDLTVRMIPARFNLDRYNGLICARVLILIRGPRSRDQRVGSTRAVDPTILLAPRRQHQGRYNSPNQARVDLINRGPALTRSTREINARRRSDAYRRATSPAR